MGETVLIKPTGRTPKSVYHKPSDDDPNRPECHIENVHEIEWVRKDRDVLPPNVRKCKYCAGTFERDSDQGPKLSNKLEELNPEEVV